MELNKTQVIISFNLLVLSLGKTREWKGFYFDDREQKLPRIKTKWKQIT